MGYSDGDSNIGGDHCAYSPSHIHRKTAALNVFFVANYPDKYAEGLPMVLYFFYSLFIL